MQAESFFVRNLSSYSFFDLLNIHMSCYELISIGVFTVESGIRHELVDERFCSEISDSLTNVSSSPESLSDFLVI